MTMVNYELVVERDKRIAELEAKLAEAERDRERLRERLYRAGVSLQTFGKSVLGDAALEER
jgi:predicted RNase H-like nuclease (RuvC/YqgF family)